MIESDFDWLRLDHPIKGQLSLPLFACGGLTLSPLTLCANIIHHLFMYDKNQMPEQDNDNNLPILIIMPTEPP